MKNNQEFKSKSKLVRKWCMVSTTEAESGHPTSCLSASDITTVLFDKYFTYDLRNPLNLYNDRFVLSKGHAAPLLYTLFGMAGAYPLEQLKTLRKFGSIFEGHPTPKFVYAEAATGSLGQGISVGCGLAIAAKRENIPFKTYVLCGDGELAEGQIWEASNFASFHKLDNLIVILDINRLAQSGPTMFQHHMQEYVNRFKSFGFEIISIDGHNYEQIDEAFQKAVNNTSGKPVAIIAETIKGKGISFLEDKEGWHGKALTKDELEKALKELGDIDDDLRFDLKPPKEIKLPEKTSTKISPDILFDKTKQYATREVFGEVLAKLSNANDFVYTLDGDVKNSTFTEDVMKEKKERFIECYIAEQNMVSVAAGLSRLGKTPFVATFAAFLTRAADQIRMARVGEANIKFIGSHVGISIGEDGPSQMGLEDISMFGTIPDSIVLQPADGISTQALVPQMLDTKGIVYMRTLRAKTSLLYNKDEKFEIGGSKILKQSADDELTIAATGITVFEAIKAAEILKQQNINVRVVDCYSIKPVDAKTLLNCVNETMQRIVLTVEDHFIHGGFGDFVQSALSSANAIVDKLAVKKISESGKKDELLKDASIDAEAIIEKIKSFLKNK